MALYAHITTKSSEQIKSFNLFDKAQERKCKIESNQFAEILFPPKDGFISLSNLLRLCFRQIKSPFNENDEVVVFYSVIRVPDFDWHKWRKELSYRDELFNLSYDSEILLSELEQRNRDKAKLSFLAPSASEEMWLNPPFMQNKGRDIWFLEEEAWINKLSSDAWKGCASEVLRVLQDFSPQDWSGKTFRWDNTREVGISYRYYENFNYLLLSDLTNSNIPISNDNYPDSNDQDTIRRRAKRAYTEEIVADKQTWLKIISEDKAKEANLSLSGEEIRILDNVKFPDAGCPRYPLFINGRAGSGKSTVLLYIFAEYVELILDRLKHADKSVLEDEIHIPLYLTCSSELKSRAMDSTQTLLRLRGHRANTDFNARQEDYLKKISQDSFQIFHKFLLDCIPEPYKTRFEEEEKYISYSKFRHLWEKRCGRDHRLKKYHPDLVWHFLRTYVKGMRPDAEEWLDTEYYEKVLEKKNRTISLETYSELFERVWHGWYKDLCLNGGYWDDQDLTMAFLEYGKVDDRIYPAVFCDEAQDFTKIEIDAILRFSLFMYRKLRPHQLSNIPIVFAGDPLQTLNPTGFRWASVKSQLFQALKPLSSRANSDPSLNHKSLENNYRSARPIVDFCNLILALRKVILKMEDVSPQQSWWPMQQIGYNEVLAFDMSHASEILSIEGTIIIVDCQEGDEAEYVRNDPVLDKIVEKDKERGIPKNVLSPSKAKGLEFSRVVLFRFGKSVESNALPLNELMQRSVEYSVDQHLPVEYFMNRLYVGASRAMAQLIIVDDYSYIKNFWQFAQNNNVLRKFEEYDPNAWDIQQFLTYGTDPEHAKASKDLEAPHKIAEKFETQGKILNDPSLLRRALMYYQQSGYTGKADLCLANALSLEGDYYRSGKQYEKAKRFEDAICQYWQAENGLPEILNISKTQSIETSLEVRAASFSIEYQHVKGNYRAIELINDFAMNLDDLSKKNFSKYIKILRDERWSGIFSQALEKILRESHQKNASIISIWQATSKIKQLGFPVKDDSYANLAFLVNEYSAAINAWNNLPKERRPKHYYIAIAETTPFPENIIPLVQAKEFDRAVKEFETNKYKKGLLDRHYTLIAIAYDLLGNHNTATELTDKLSSVELLRSSLNEWRTEKLSNAFKIHSTILILKHYATNANWKEFASFIQQLERESILPDRKVDRSELTKFDNTILELMTLIPDQELESEVITILQDYIKILLTGTDKPKATIWPSIVWKDACEGLSIRYVGFALERILKLHKAALPFYEVMESAKRLGHEDREFARIRLVKTRAKYADYLSAEGLTKDAHSQKLRIDEIRARFSDIPRPENIPEFPDVSIQHSSPKKEGLEYQIGHRRFILKFQDGGTVLINCQGVSGKIRLDLLANSVYPLGNLRLKTMADNNWSCDDWQLTVTILSGHRFRLQVMDQDFETISYPKDLLGL